MTQVLVDRRDLEFVLYEQLNIEQLFQTPRYRDFNRQTVDLIISEARNLAVKELLPAAAEGDREGCRFENGRVSVPDCFRRLFDLFREGGWITSSDNPAVGGQGMPFNVAQATGEYFGGANGGFCMYPLTCHGAAKLIENYGTPEQKKLFMEKIYTGEWAGTMALTEPQAGTDVGALTTSARENPDGTYSISGQKIFISGAEQNLTENIIHPVLARIEGAPAGTAGISLFLVPKIWVNPDGSLGDHNDVICTGIEEKMGLHGSATCQMSFGANGKCRGWLLGEKNKGLTVMFQMMNEIRVGTGSSSTAVASAAYLYALHYARDRVQGKHLTRILDPAAPSVPIIEHPDVRRVLLELKAVTEGMRSLNYFIGNLFDQAAVTEDVAEQKSCHRLISLLTPIAKAYCSDRAFEACSQAMQVFGGYGYCRDYPIERLLRDCKIACIAEGANGIQAMDLLGRKIALDQGRTLAQLADRIHATVAEAKALEEVAKLAGRLEPAVDRLTETAQYLGQAMMEGKIMAAFAHAYPFLTGMGDVLLAWMHLDRARLAAVRLRRLSPEPESHEQRIKDNRDVAYYDGMLKTAEFYICGQIPLALSRLETVKNLTTAAVDIHDRSFGG